MPRSRNFNEPQLHRRGDGIAVHYRIVCKCPEPTRPLPPKADYDNTFEASLHERVDQRSDAIKIVVLGERTNHLRGARRSGASSCGIRNCHPCSHAVAPTVFPISLALCTT